MSEFLREDRFPGNVIASGDTLDDDLADVEEAGEADEARLPRPPSLHVADGLVVVKYERLFNLGNYENIKVGVEVTTTEADAPDALRGARAFVHHEANLALQEIRGSNDSPF